MDIKEAKKKLDAVVNSTNKSFGEGSVTTLNSGALNIESIPSGCFMLDNLIGVGGFPKGRIIELFGEEGAGKSSIAQITCANYQKGGGLVGYIDLENAFNKTYAAKFGMNFDLMAFSQPNSGDEGLAIMEKFIEKGIGLVILDSVAAIVSKKELEGEIYDDHVALQARLMSQALRRLSPLVRATNACVIFINQVRMKIGVRFGNPEVTPGGKALKFYSSVRLQVWKSAQLKDDKGVVYGDLVAIKTVKNKVAPPFRTIKVNMIWGKGLDDVPTLVEQAVAMDIIKNPKQGTYLLPDGKTEVRGKEKLVEVIKSDDKMYKKLAVAVLERSEDVVTDVPLAALEETGEE